MKLSKYLPDIVGQVDKCPKCGKNFKGLDIFEHFKNAYNGDEQQALKTAECYGWTQDNPKSFRCDHFIEVQGYYDGAVFIACPKCESYWRRFKWVNPNIITGGHNNG